MLPFKLFFHRGFTVDLGPHVFPAQKYRLVYEQLLASGVAESSDFVEPRPATDEDVMRVHTQEYVERIKTGTLSAQELWSLEVPWSRALVDGTWLAAGAAIEAGRRAKTDGCAVVIGGGFHHAFPDHGEGFCLIHDVAIAVAALRATGEIHSAAIIDLDVHHGNGTATIFASDPDVFTLSIHQEQNYPGVKPHSNLDVGLPDGAGDREYLAALDGALPMAFGFHPEMLFYLAGADPFANDLLGGLGLTTEALMERDRRVFMAARSSRVPVAATLAGGYAQDPADTVTIHVNTVKVATEVYRRDGA